MTATNSADSNLWRWLVLYGQKLFDLRKQSVSTMDFWDGLL